MPLPEMYYEAQRSTEIAFHSTCIKDECIFMHVTLGRGPLYPLVNKPFEHGL